MREILRGLIEVVSAAGDHPSVLVSLRNLLDEIELAHADPALRRAVVRSIITLYQQGMDGFQDVVLQDAHGVKAEHAHFDQLRHSLFEAVQRELS